MEWLKARAAWIASGIVLVLVGVALVALWRRAIQAENELAARAAQDTAAVGTAEVQKQTDAAAKALEAGHADELRAIQEQCRVDEQRLRADPDALARFLRDQGRAAADAGPRAR